jgi:hypothetical protein
MLLVLPGSATAVGAVFVTLATPGLAVICAGAANCADARFVANSNGKTTIVAVTAVIILDLFTYRDPPWINCANNEPIRINPKHPLPIVIPQADPCCRALANASLMVSAFPPIDPDCGPDTMGAGDSDGRVVGFTALFC